jgi:hypothetical protein
LAPKVRVQPLLVIYTAKIRFTRKIIFFPEDTLTEIQGFVVQTDRVWGLVSKIGFADNLAA